MPYQITMSYLGRKKLRKKKILNDEFHKLISKTDHFHEFFFDFFFQSCAYVRGGYSLLFHFYDLTNVNVKRSGVSKRAVTNWFVPSSCGADADCNSEFEKSKPSLREGDYSASGEVSLYSFYITVLQI